MEKGRKNERGSRSNVKGKTVMTLCELLGAQKKIHEQISPTLSISTEMIPKKKKSKKNSEFSIEICLLV
jgi:hypothetical protein